MGVDLYSSLSIYPKQTVQRNESTSLVIDRNIINSNRSFQWENLAIYVIAFPSDLEQETLDVETDLVSVLYESDDDDTYTEVGSSFFDVERDNDTFQYKMRYKGNKPYLKITTQQNFDAYIGQTITVVQSNTSSLDPYTDLGLIATYDDPDTNEVFTGNIAVSSLSGNLRSFEDVAIYVMCNCNDEDSLINDGYFANFFKDYFGNYFGGNRS